MPQSNMPQRWYPTTSQLKDPVALERSFRQLLTQHYALHDRIEAMQQQHAAGQSQAAANKSGPATTEILGLRIQPIDTQTLADGATLKWDKKSGSFKVS